jgi:hypothetical protein
MPFVGREAWRPDFDVKTVRVFVVHCFCFGSSRKAARRGFSYAKILFFIFRSLNLFFPSVSSGKNFTKKYMS